MRREERERVWNKGIRNGRWRGREAAEKESRRRREAQNGKRLHPRI